MQANTRRFAETGDGLVPAGRYFAKLAADLDEARPKKITRKAPRARPPKTKDDELERLYRRASASRANTFADAALM